MYFMIKFTFFYNVQIVYYASIKKALNKRIKYNIISWAKYKYIPIYIYHIPYIPICFRLLTKYTVATT